MLDTLDPHSFFLAPRDYQGFLETQHGGYSGLGVTLAMVDHKPTVVALVAGGPASRAGIRSGDVIAQIEGKATDKVSAEESLGWLRGPNGATINLSVQREGVPELLNFSVPYEELPRHSIVLACCLSPGIGYIRIASLTETTINEFNRAVRRFGPHLSGLILDLRNSPGGNLQAALQVAGKFLDRGQVIFITADRTSKKGFHHKTGTRGELASTSLVVLTDRGTASGSEIIAGAIQDNGHGLIVGEATFGKGCVQTVFPLSCGAGLALTTARWYTPCGRPISTGIAHVQELPAPRQIRNTRFYSTCQQRQAKTILCPHGSCAGIVPDFEVKKPNLNKLQIEPLRKSAFFHFIQWYNSRFPVGGLPEKGDEIVSLFRQFLISNQIQFQETPLRSDQDFVLQEIKYEYTLSKEGLEKAELLQLKTDPQVVKAEVVLLQASDPRSPNSRTKPSSGHNSKFPVGKHQFMDKILNQSIKRGIVTTPYPGLQVDFVPNFRGKPIIDFERAVDCLPTATCLTSWDSAGDGVLEEKLNPSRIFNS